MNTRVEGDLSPSHGTDGKHQIRMVTFRDWDIFYKWPWFKSVKWTDDNKIGYVTKAGLVIYPILRTWTKVPLKDLKPRRMMSLEVDENLAENVERFFTENVPNRRLFYMGVNAIPHPENRSAVFDHPIKLPVLTPITQAERTARWDQMTKIIQSGDFVFCINTDSLVSRLIARFDHGAWSHTAWYIGGGYVSEAIPKYGVCVRHMELYNTPSYRVGIYRPMYEDGGVEEVLKGHMEKFGDRYDYVGLMSLALRKIIGLKSKPPKVSPNELAIELNCPIVHIV